MTTGKPKVGGGALRMVRALRHPNYLLYWVSGLGMTAAQGVKQLVVAWLVLDMTGSVGQLGIVVFMQGIPAAIMGLFGGVMADRYNRRMLLVWSQVLSMANILALAFLTIGNMTELWHIYVSSIILGATQSMTMPARNAFMRGLVPPEDMMNAVALNSMQMQSGRIIWPSVAGALIAFTGVGWALVANASFYVIGIGALMLMRGLPADLPRRRASPMTELAEGMKYTFATPHLAMIMTIALGVGCFGLAFMQMGPGFAYQVMQFGPKETGWFLAASGIGAIGGSLVLMALDVKNKNKLFVGLAFVFSFSLIGLSLNPTYWGAFFFMGLFGLASSTLSVVAQTIFQTTIPSQLLGRATSLWSVAGGLGSITSLPIGLIGQAYGLRWSLGGVAVMLFMVVLWRGVIRYPGKAIREAEEAAARVPPSTAAQPTRPQAG